MHVKFHHPTANSIPVIKMNLYLSFINSKKETTSHSFLFVIYLSYFTVLLHQVLCKDLPQHLIFQG